MVTKLYLGKTKDISKDDLRHLVSQYGLVKAFEDKESYCFVEYFYESDARIAQIELDGKVLNGCKLVAQFSKNSIKVDDISKEALPSSTKRVYVGNLNYKFNQQELQVLFQRFGEINEFIHKDTYALVEFNNQQSATQAIMHLNDVILKGETLKVEMQKCYDEVLTSTNRIFIGKINANIKKPDLVYHFGQFGFIEDITIKEEHYAFIQYKNVLQASKAIKEMNGATIKDCKIIVQEAKSKMNQHHLQHNHINQQPQMVAIIPSQIAYPVILNQPSPMHFYPQMSNQQMMSTGSMINPPQMMQQNNLNNMFLPELSLQNRSRSRSREKKNQFKM